MRTRLTPAAPAILRGHRGRAGPRTPPRASHVRDRGLDQLAAEILADAQWYPRAGPERGAVRVTDSLALADAVLLWAAVRGRPGQLVLLAARRHQRSLRPVSTAAAMLALATRPRWTTSAGSTVSWTGPPGGARLIAAVAATATNDVARIQLGGTPALLKAYRIVGDGRAEHRALIAAASGQLGPKVLARIGYQRRGRTGQAPLALVTEAISGQTLDVLLRRSLEAAWRAGHGALSAADLDLLARVRAAVHALHGCLLPPDPDIGRLATRLPVLLADIQVTRLFLPGSAAAHRLLDLAAGRAAAACAGGPFITGPAHGDLHLSHVLVDGPQVRFVDPGSGGAAAAPPDDFAALHRAVECMCLDLQVGRMAEGQDAERAAASALRAAAWAAGSLDPGWRPWERQSRNSRRDTGSRDSQDRDCRAAAVTRVAEQWCANVVAAVAGQRAGQVAELCYLARLLHDLRYHTERGQAYYADLAWWHLARLLATRSARSAETAAR